MAERTTSFAKSIDGLVHEESALDRARSLRDGFLARHAEPEPQKQRETEKPAEKTQGSEMVRSDAPVLRPTPSGPMRNGPDRQAAYGRLDRERAQAKQKISAAELAAAFRARGRGGHDRDRDHDR